MREYLKGLLGQFMAITTGSTLAAAISISITAPDISLKVELLWQILLLSFLTTCPGILFYSKKELNRRQYGIRTGIHYVIVLLILVIGGRQFHWLDMDQNENIIFFMILVTIVYAVIIVYTCKRDRQVSHALNEAIAKYRAKDKQH